MNVCIKCSRLQLALEVYGMMRGSAQCPPNVVTFNTLVDVYGKLGQWEKAVGVVDAMKKEVGEGTLACVGGGSRGSSPMHSPPTLVYFLIASAVIPHTFVFRLPQSAMPRTRSRCPSLSLSYIFHTYVQGVEPVLRTYNTLIIACNMCGQPREALNVYARLVSDGYQPNSTTYNALIRCGSGVNRC